MTFVVTENCIKCKYMDCVEVCPVDCFHEGPNFLVIDPDECIDCTLCEPGGLEGRSTKYCAMSRRRLAKLCSQPDRLQPTRRCREAKWCRSRPAARSSR